MGEKQPVQGPDSTTPKREVSSDGGVGDIPGIVRQGGRAVLPVIHLTGGAGGELYVVCVGITRRLKSYVLVIHNIKCFKHNIMCETDNRG